MRSALLLLAACGGVDEPTVVDGTYQIVAPPLATTPADAHLQGTLPQPGNRRLENQLGAVLALLTDDLGVAPIEASTTADLQLWHDTGWLEARDNQRVPLGHDATHIYAELGAADLSIALPGFDPIALDLEHASIYLDAETLAGMFGGTVSVSQVRERLAPPAVTLMNQILARDCTALDAPPKCGCAAGTPGEEVSGIFMFEGRCAVTVEQIFTNGLLASELLPDYAPAELTFGMAITTRQVTSDPAARLP